MANAVMSCRQSVALAPNAPQGFSMLGLLLERTGDLEQAAAAYARVLKLAPGSRLEMESLERIRATLNSRRGEAPAFRFGEREMDEALASAPPSALATAAASSVAPAAPSALQAGALAPAIATSSIGRAPDGSALSNPLGSAAPHANAPMPLIVGGAGAAPSISALNFDMADAAGPEPWWKSALARPSAFSRGLPLAGVAGLSLLFLIWARGATLSRYPQDSQLPVNIDSTPLNTSEVPPVPGSDAGSFNGSTSAPGISGSSTLAPGAPPGVAGPNDAYPVSNRPGAPSNAAPAPNGAVAGAPAASGSAPSNAGNQNRNGQNMGGGRMAPAGVNQNVPSRPRPQPNFPSSERVLAPAPPSSLPPARQLPGPAAPSAPSAPARSPYTGLSSSGGGPLGPSTSSNRNSITLTQPRSPSAAPPRASSARSDAEAAAVRAANTRRPDTVIASSSQAIRSGGETGWNYQQRALGFLNRGDNQRAADDFQSAISAYNDQIARGEAVDAARGGVTACRAGLTLALQRMGR